MVTRSVICSALYKPRLTVPKLVMVSVPSCPMDERDAELARKNDGVGGVDAEGQNNPMWEADKEVDLGTFVGGGGASTYPKRAAIREVSEASGVHDGPLSLTCIANGSPGDGLEELTMFSCKGCLGGASLVRVIVTCVTVQESLL